MDAPRVTLKRTEQANQNMHRTQTFEKKEVQSDVYVYGPPVVHWVQTMREKLTKAKTAGFDHDRAFLQRRVTAQTVPSHYFSQQHTSPDTEIRAINNDSN